MAEAAILKGYSGQTTEELIALEGKYRTDTIVMAFREALQSRRYPSAEERIILAVEALEGAVNGDGYDGFFANETEYVPQVVAALREIGCLTVAEITQAAIDTLKLKGPLTADAIEEAMDEDDDRRDKRLDKLDERYYQEAGDLAGPLFEFIKANRSKIAVG